MRLPHIDEKVQSNQTCLIFGLKELNEENSKQKNEILKLKKNNDVLYKIIYKNNNNINI